MNCIKDFRHAVVNSLKDANIVGIGQNVSASREMKAWPDEESFIIVNMPGVDFDDKSTSPRFYFAKSELRIDIYARSFLSGENDIEGADSISDLNDFLDDTMHAVAAVIDPCPYWKGPYQGLVSKCVLRSYTNNLSERSETTRGAATITFEVSFTAKIDRTAATKEWLRANNTIKTGSQSIEFTTELRPGNQAEAETADNSAGN
ncbi:MAG: hypothetical protein J6R21_06965 [Bacteroidales bacterium]|nr:hypothetical protein [Bacteroidales bacterium]MBO5819415.1 hypothetical protein [Bacteroidales bacterium]